MTGAAETNATTPKRSLGIALMLGALALALVSFLLARGDAPALSSLHAWERDLYRDVAMMSDGVDGVPAPGAAALLTEAGFDGNAIIRTLTLLGVPPTSFALPFYNEGALVQGEERERACLAEAIYYEARNQPVVGRIAVADVVLNRVADRRFPKTICGVVFQGQGRGACQFSFACDGSLDRGHEPRAWKEATALADIIFRGFRPPLTGLATYYHADYVMPYWAKVFERTKRVGDHVFYRPEGSLGLAAKRLGFELPDSAT